MLSSIGRVFFELDFQLIVHLVFRDHFFFRHRWLLIDLLYLFIEHVDCLSTAISVRRFDFCFFFSFAFLFLFLFFLFDDRFSNHYRSLIQQTFLHRRNHSTLINHFPSGLCTPVHSHLRRCMYSSKRSKRESALIIAALEVGMGSGAEEQAHSQPEE